MSDNLKTLRYHYKYKSKVIDGEITLDLSRFETQFKDAQFKLDSMVMRDMVEFMPMDTGQFINVTKSMSAAIAGSGIVVAAAPPFGRFLYEGEVMEGVRSKSPWAKKGEKKQVTGRQIQYTKTKHPDAQSHWFEPAKKKNLKKWVRVTKKTAGGGK